MILIALSVLGRFVAHSGNIKRRYRNEPVPPFFWMQREGNATSLCVGIGVIIL
mgnify:CR=1 FL=1